MLITDEYAFAHIPKTGGHALALMLAKAGYKFHHCPFIIVDGVIKNATSGKHKTFEQMKYNIEGKKKVITIRRLSDWWLSFMWHQSKHTIINTKNNIAKNAIPSYSEKAKETEPKVLLPAITCFSTYPDYLLSCYLDANYKQSDFTFLRMENLVEDLYTELNINVDRISGEKHTYKPPKRYWTPETVETLYFQNPKWARLEKVIYND